MSVHASFSNLTYKGRELRESEERDNQIVQRGAFKSQMNLKKNNAVSSGL